ncbi:hypothetical protein SKAU_G00179710 [Synaphobranchus kaupii]|uniref:CWH43-like N-terminal domain-containing protein n=1 Tax=Synaphobranchus kaupii TaxID=118154 RepID=A0A9Q1FM58_SYNKA|nr:hypothetical protein SKAU_G00179710 [Synaphobranchus kaupii]
MCIWMILPVSLPAFTITGIWVVYAMARYNQHVCPVDNWLYNQSCEVELPLQRGPVLCCTLDNVPLISKCGTLPPESCFFSLICSTGSFMVMVIVLLRYAHVIEKHQHCVLNTASLCTGWICAAGLIMVGNFQVDHAKVLHYVGAGVAFPTGLLFLSLQSALTYRLAKTQSDHNMGHLRCAMTLLAFISLALSGVFFIQESFVLQHASAVFEWVFCLIIMLFYGTFAFEFWGVSGDTLMVLAKGGAQGQGGVCGKGEPAPAGEPPCCRKDLKPPEMASPTNMQTLEVDKTTRTGREYSGATRRGDAGYFCCWGSLVGPRDAVVEENESLTCTEPLNST